VSDDDRCGVCKWFRPGEYTGTCHYPLSRFPSAMVQARYALAVPWPMTTERDGELCPTFERDKARHAADAR